jgi:carboxymethylenebutenolidase
MASSWIKINAAEGGSFDGYLSVPASGSGPGLVVVQEIFGVNPSIRQAADMFAAEGFVALAPDMFWRTQPRIELGFDEAGTKRAQELHQGFDYAQGAKDLGATVAALRKQPQVRGPVAVTGFCLGGTFAYLASTRLKVEGAVAYYGTRIHQYLEEAGSVRCPLLLHFGEADHTTPPDVIEKIRGALGKNPRVQIHTYPGAKHAFANAARAANYDPKSAALAHQRTYAFLRGLSSKKT